MNPRTVRLLFVQGAFFVSLCSYKSVLTGLTVGQQVMPAGAVKEDNHEALSCPNEQQQPPFDSCKDLTVSTVITDEY